ncbi:MAG: tetratricopeptide repeat protein [Isosphaerales bacterium]
MPMDVSEAREWHRLGWLDRAARIYEAALAEEPDRPDVLHLLGLVTLQRGDSKQAAVLIGRAIAVRPTEAAYHASLAEACWALGELDRAVGCCRTALRLQPDSPEVLCNLGATLVDQGDLDTAIGHFRDALRLRPDFVEAHNNLGNVLRLMGGKAAALEHFREAVRLDPTASEARSNLGKMLLERGEAQEALGHCQQVLQLRPNSHEAQNNLGNVLYVLGRLDLALACFREAVRLKPDLASAHAGLGAVLEELGELDQAQTSFREALRHDPRHAGALARLATRLRANLPEADLATIEDLLADPDLPTEQRWPLQFGLAHSLDARQEFDRAAALTLQANALQLTDFQKGGRGYEPGRHRKFVDHLIAAFTPRFFAQVRGFGLDTERPVFVVGMPRSGTTLIEQVLASHPRVFGAGELRLARETFQGVPEAVGRAEAPLDCVEYLDRNAAQYLARRHLNELAALDGSADRVVDKMPENTLYLGLIAALFPRAKLIHCRRDVRDVALSCWMTHFAQVRWACDPDHIASRVHEYQRVMNYWRRVLPVPVFEVDYEDMVADPERVSRELVAWCALEWDPVCLEFYKTRRPVRTTSVAQVRQPLYSSSVGRWKNYERSLAPLFGKLKNDP